MNNPYGGYYVAPSSTWSPHSSYGYQPSQPSLTTDNNNVAEGNAGESEGESDSDESDDGSKTVVPPLRSGQMWSCTTCWTRRYSTEDADCRFCEANTPTITRWCSSKKPVEIDSDGNESEGQDPTTPWICYDCQNPKLFLGGEYRSEPIFDGFCVECNDKTYTMYADRSPSYCCCGCRYERPNGPLYQQIDGSNKWLEAWKEYCEKCQDETDTEKLDEDQAERYCCIACRGDRGSTRGTGRVWCQACGRRTMTTEIDEVVDEDEERLRDSIAEEDEEDEEE